MRNAGLVTLRASTLLTALLVAGGFDALGCRQLVGVHEREAAPLDAGSGTTLGQCGGFGYATKSCAACMDAKCCDEAVDCHGSPHCDARLSCFLACAPDDAECRAACFDYWGSDIGAHYEAVLHVCLAKSCPAECAVPCGGRHWPSASCEACVNDKCCAEARACQEDDRCSLPGLCGCNVNDDKCFAKCAEEHPTSVALMTELRTCRQNKCSTCSQPVWGCLDAPRSWLKPGTAADIGVIFRLQDFVTYAPKANVAISACKAADIACGTQVATATSSATGFAELTVPPGLLGFSGYFQLFPAPGDPDPVVKTILQHTSPPLVEHVDFVRAVLSQAQFNTFALLLLEGKGADPELGHLVLQAADCNENEAAGVVFELADPTLAQVGFYLDENGLPSKTLTKTMAPTQLGGFGNVKPGSVTVLARVAATGQKVSEINVIVRKDTLTFTVIGPAP